MSKDDHPTLPMPGRRLASGVRVEVWGRVTERWVPGYQIVATSPHGYVVRRLSDRVVLRRLFGDSDVRVAPIPMPHRGWTPGSAA